MKCRSCFAIQLKYLRAGSSQRRSSPMPVLAADDVVVGNHARRQRFVEPHLLFLLGDL